MKVSEITKIPLDISPPESHRVFSTFGSIPVVLFFSGCELSVYSSLDGSLMKRLHSPDVIEKVIECSFNGYGNCIAALSYSFCNIWSSLGELYSVVLPCRMSAMYAIDGGILFERIDDLFSMNTSFTISTPIHSIPMYFSLVSPLGIPKPILQKQEGEELTVTALNLSRMVNTSMDLFSSRIGDNQDREVSIISVLRDVHLLFLYNNSTYQHYLFRWISTESASLGLPSEEAILESVMNDDQGTLNDSFIQLLSSPEYCLERVFQGMDSYDAFLSICWIEVDSFVFLYCQLKNSIRVYQTQKDSFLDTESPFPIDIDFIQEIQGVIVDRIPDTPFLLIRFGLDWGIVFGSTLLVSGVKSTIKDSVTTDLHSDPSQSVLRKYVIDQRIVFEMTESVIELWFIRLHLDPISEKLLKIVEPLIGNVFYSENGFQIESSEQPLLFLADYSWIINDQTTLDYCTSRLSSDHVLLDAYSSSSPYLWEKASESMQLPISMILQLLLIQPQDKRIQERMELYERYRIAGEIPLQVLHSFIANEFNERIGIGVSPILNYYEVMADLQKQRCISVASKPSPLLQEIWNLLSFFLFADLTCSPHVVNLHLSSENTSVNVPRTIQEKIEAQLLSSFGNALIQPLLDNSSNPSWLQQLHSLSYHLILSGRKNDESDVMDCEFSRGVLFSSRVQNTIIVLSRWLRKYSSFSITMNDLDYLLDSHPVEEQIGILLSLGFSGHLRSLPLALYKHKLVFCYSQQWRSNSHQQVEIDYQLEAAVSVPVCIYCSFYLHWQLLINHRITIKSSTF